MINQNCSCGVKFRMAEDFRDHLPCSAEEKKRLSGPTVIWCQEHQINNGGKMRCLICSCKEMEKVLSEIDYLLGEPNEMEVSEYDVHYNSSVVVEKLCKYQKEKDKEINSLRETIDDLSGEKL